MEKKFIFSMDVDWVRGSEIGVPSVLDFCDQLDLVCTFFVAGKFARDYPDFVKEMLIRNHPVATHGWDHGETIPDESYGSYSLDEMRRRIGDATDALTKVMGSTPTVFRAPNLDLGEEMFTVLEEFGYVVDSSVPTRRFDMGVGQVNTFKYYMAPLHPYFPSRDHLGREGDSPILEIPPSSFWFPVNMSGLRTFGLGATKWAIKRVLERSSVLTFYGHPSEFVPAEKMPAAKDWPSRHRKNLGPHHLDLLKKLVDFIREQGCKDVKIMDVSP